MKVCTLKIDTGFYEMIKTGKKNYDIRKTNKNYIQANDIIHFVNLDGNHLGYAKVKEVDIDFFETVLRWHLKLDKYTLSFVKENYNKENLLLMIEVEPMLEVE